VGVGGRADQDEEDAAAGRAVTARGPLHEEVIVAATGLAIPFPAEAAPAVATPKRGRFAASATDCGVTTVRGLFIPTAAVTPGLGAAGFGIAGLTAETGRKAPGFGMAPGLAATGRTEGAPILGAIVPAVDVPAEAQRFVFSQLAKYWSKVGVPL